MRWTDLPRDRETGGDRDRPVVQRGEWEDLKLRLERLPAGHPSSLDDEGRADADQGEDGRAESGRAGDARAGEDRAGEDRADKGGDQPARRGRAGPDRAPGAHGPGRSESYRPWFASGESPEPWFSADPDA